MKLQVAILVFLSSSFALAIGPLAPGQEALAKKINEDCSKETGIPKPLLEKAWKGEVEDDEKLKQFDLCFCKKAKLINDAGEIQPEQFKSFMGPEAGDKMTKCAQGKHSSAADAAEHIAKCFKENFGLKHEEKNDKKKPGNEEKSMD